LTLNLLVERYITGGLHSAEQTAQAIFEIKQANPGRLCQIIRFGKASGHRLQDAITVCYPQGENDFIPVPPHLLFNVWGILSEYWYLSYRFGQMKKDWTLTTQALITEGGRTFDAMSIDLRSGKEATIYFDISQFRK
jgi:hypothetical protein